MTFLRFHVKTRIGRRIDLPSDRLTSNLLSFFSVLPFVTLRFKSIIVYHEALTSSNNFVINLRTHLIGQKNSCSPVSITPINVSYNLSSDLKKMPLRLLFRDFEYLRRKSVNLSFVFSPCSRKQFSIQYKKPVLRKKIWQRALACAYKRSRDRKNFSSHHLTFCVCFFFFVTYFFYNGSFSYLLSCSHSCIQTYDTYSSK